MNSFDPIKSRVAERLASVLQDQFQLAMKTEDLAALLEKPPEAQLGDYAFPCFRLAKEIKLNPQGLAQQVAEKLSGGVVKEAVTAGAFLNIRIEPKAMKDSLFKSVADRSYFNRIPSSRTSRKVMIEYSQPNTHKEFHVGHVRNVALGDAMVRMGRYCGDEVIAANYPGDEGTHIAKCLWWIRRQGLTPPHSRRGEWLGEQYAEAVRALATDPHHEEISAVLRGIESKHGEVYDLWRTTREWSLALFHQIYDYLNVQFDVYFFESELSEDSQKIVDEYLRQGVFVESEGAIGCDLSDAKLGFMLVRKRDGNTLYATKDLVLARRKFSDFAIESSMYVVAAEQNLHFKQVFKTLEKMGFHQAKECFHLSYGHVRLPEGKMSSREGTAISFASMREAIETELDTALAEVSADWNEEERLETRRRLCVAAIKYGMLSTDPVKDVVYRAADWVAFEGDTGPYLLYTYARTQSILRKAHAQGLEPNSVFAELLQDPTELALVRVLYDLNDAVVRAYTQAKPSLVAHHLYDLCKAFNRMYAQVSVLKAETKELAGARLALLEVQAVILARGMQLLGLEPVERM